MNISNAVSAYQKQSDIGKGKTGEVSRETGTVQSGKSDFGKTIGEPKLSAEAEKYYSHLKKKFGQYDFILVSSAEKDNARANAGKYANSLRTVVLIDEEKIEKINERIKKSYKDKLDGNIPSGLSDDDWQEMIQEWAAEKDRLIVKLNERMQKSKILYDKLNLLIMFCNHLPELYRVATPQMKREVIQTCVRTLTYDGKNLIIELFPLFYEFKKWKNVKNGAANRTISEPIKLFNIMEQNECQYLFTRIQKLIAA